MRPGCKHLIEEIVDERLRQDEQWGGPDHDDNHDPLDWAHFIEKQIKCARRETLYAWIDRRERYLKIAALAIAAVESGDRRYGLP